MFVRVPWRYPRFFVNLEVFHIGKLEHQLNEEIRDKEVRVIGADGAQLGIMSAADAQRLAYEKDLDLVKIAPNATPPVCKIMDYGKFRFEQLKKEKEAKKNQRVVEIKEVRMSPNIDTNDFNVKLKNAQKFLKEGNRVKVTVRFRGREMAHTELGVEVMKRFAAAMEGQANIDKQPKLEGRSMLMFMSPAPAKTPAKTSKTQEEKKHHPKSPKIITTFLQNTIDKWFQKGYNLVASKR